MDRCSLRSLGRRPGQLKCLCDLGRAGRAPVKCALLPIAPPLTVPATTPAPPMLAQQRDAITELFAAALTALDAAAVAPVLERPRDPTHGDVACTVALQLAKARKLNPR